MMPNTKFDGKESIPDPIWMLVLCVMFVLGVTGAVMMFVFL